MFAAAALPAPSSPYTIICDAGSTGTRLYVYRLDDERGDVQIQEGPKAVPGLSAQSRETVGPYLLPSVLEASEMIPPEHRAATPVHLYATAGMRFLPEEEQKALYDAAFGSLTSSSAVPFRVERENLRTIDGDDEGYFAALAVNYLAGRLGSDLNILAAEEGTAVDWDADWQDPLVGALDLGGASAQIVFHADGRQRRRQLMLRGSEGRVEEAGLEAGGVRRLSASADERRGVDEGPGGPVRRDDFFSISLLGYGAERMREHLEAELVARQRRHTSGRRLAAAASESHAAAPVSNPCGFRGHRATVDGVVYIGTGNGRRCMQALGHVMRQNANGDLCTPGQYCDILGAHHPRLHGDFFAIGLHYYAFAWAQTVLKDMEERGALGKQRGLRQLLEAPNPPLHALEEATDVVCSAEYSFLVDMGHANDAMLREKLPHRCMEFCLAVSLLDRFGFSPRENHVHFVDTIQDHKAEWTLGAFLHLLNSDQTGGASTLGLKSKASNALQRVGIFSPRPLSDSGMYYPIWLAIGGILIGCLRLITVRLRAKG
uniref:Uncharacterized protein n=1 Tax=Odontella aurita TaxID=265563 RepID=A0A7S4K752_9STRA